MTFFMTLVMMCLENLIIWVHLVQSIIQVQYVPGGVEARVWDCHMPTLPVSKCFIVGNVREFLVNFEVV